MPHLQSARPTPVSALPFDTQSDASSEPVSAFGRSRSARPRAWALRRCRLARKAAARCSSRRDDEAPSLPECGFLSFSPSSIRLIPLAAQRATVLEARDSTGKMVPEPAEGRRGAPGARIPIRERRTASLRGGCPLVPCKRTKRRRCNERGPGQSCPGPRLSSSPKFGEDLVMEQSDQNDDRYRNSDQPKQNRTAHVSQPLHCICEYTTQDIGSRFRNNFT